MTEQPQLNTEYFDMVSNLIRERVGELVRKAREETGLSQAELAEQLGRRQAYVSELENGKTEPNITSLLFLSKALSKPIDYFIPADFHESIAYPKIDHETLTADEHEIIQQLRQLTPLSEFHYSLGTHLIKSLIEYHKQIGYEIENDLHRKRD